MFLLAFKSSLYDGILSNLTALKGRSGNIKESPTLLGFIWRVTSVYGRKQEEEVCREGCHAPGILWIQISGLSLLQFHWGGKQRRKMVFAEWMTDYQWRNSAITHSTISHAWAIKISQTQPHPDRAELGSYISVLGLSQVTDCRSSWCGDFTIKLTQWCILPESSLTVITTL